MTKKMQARRAQSRKAVFVWYCLKNNSLKDTIP